MAQMPEAVQIQISAANEYARRLQKLTDGIDLLCKQNRALTEAIVIGNCLLVLLLGAAAWVLTFLRK